MKVKYKYSRKEIIKFINNDSYRWSTTKPRDIEKDLLATTKNKCTCYYVGTISTPSKRIDTNNCPKHELNKKGKSIMEAVEEKVFNQPLPDPKTTLKEIEELYMDGDFGDIPPSNEEITFKMKQVIYAVNKLIKIK